MSKKYVERPAHGPFKPEFPFIVVDPEGKSVAQCKTPEISAALVRLLNKICPSCGMGIDNNGDGDCVFCAGMREIRNGVWQTESKPRTVDEARVREIMRHLFARKDGDSAFSTLNDRGLYQFQKEYHAGDVVHLDGRTTSYFALKDNKQQPPAGKGSEVYWVEFPRINMPYADVVFQLRSLAGRVLTLLDAMISNESQLTAFKKLIKKEFREQLNRVRSYFTEADYAEGSDSSEEELPDDLF